MKKYKVICEMRDHGVIDSHTVLGNFYDVTNGDLDIFIDENNLVATFCPGYWKCIYYVECDENGK